MKITKQVKVTKDETVDIICNICRKTCMTEQRSHPDSPNKNSFGLLEVQVEGGYGSEVIGDMKIIKFSVCEFCLEKHLLSKMTIPVEVKSDNNSEYVTEIFEKRFERQEQRLSKVQHIQALIKKGYKKEDLIDLSNKALYDLSRRK